MKTLKTIFAGIALLFLGITANANVKPTSTGPTKTDIVNSYIDAISYGKVNTLANILGDGLQFNAETRQNISTINKDQLLDYIKNNSVAKAPITTNTTMIIENYNTYVVKVEFKYADLTRTDMLTVENVDGWKITKVQSSFK